MVEAALFQLEGAEVLVAIIASGACEKYPDFRFVLGESGVTWIPYVLDRFDTEYEDRGTALGFSMKPSDYFRRNGLATYQQDQFIGEIAPLIGEDTSSGVPTIPIPTASGPSPASSSGTTWATYPSEHGAR